MSLKETLYGPYRPLKDKLAEVKFGIKNPGTYPLDVGKTQSSTPNPEAPEAPTDVPTYRKGRVVGVPSKKQPDIQIESGDNEVFRKGIVYNENRGAIAAGEDPYKTVGSTGDLGKYQVSPETLATTWPKAWAGKDMTEEEFLNDPDAQETFFNEFIRVKERYEVPDEDAAIMWHRGWGVLGNPNDESGKKKTFEEKKKELFEYLDRIRDEEKSQKYLKSFKEGVSMG